MNMLVLVLGITVTAASVLIVMERYHFMRRAVGIWEKRIKNVYACEGLLLYGIAYLKEKGELPRLPLDRRASLICRENSDGTKTVEAFCEGVTIRCLVLHKGCQLEVLSWQQQ